MGAYAPCVTSITHWLPSIIPNCGLDSGAIDERKARISRFGRNLKNYPILDLKIIDATHLCSTASSSANTCDMNKHLLFRVICVVYGGSMRPPFRAV